MQPIKKYLIFIVMVLSSLHITVIKAASLQVTVVDTNNEPVADAVISLSGDIKSKASAAKAIMEQEGRMFVPFVLPVQVGTTVAFPNHDKVKHHVYSFSEAKSFEIKLYSGDEDKSELFDKVGVVALGCNIHDWMLGYIYVVDTPYFSKTNGKGEATLSNIPVGNYKVNIWQPRMKGDPEKYTKTMKINSNETIKFNLDLKRMRNISPPDFAEEGY